MNFKISISTVPYTDKNSISWGKVKYQQREISIADFVELVKQGYSFCHCFKSKGEVMSQTEKRDSNFVSAQMIFVDVDDAEIPMCEFVAELSKQPTIAYTTPNNHTYKSKWLYRFRLCYLFDKSITDANDYSALYDSIMQSVCNDVVEFVSKDNCGRKVSQQFGGNARNDVEVITSNNVFTFLDFPFQNNNASLSSLLFSNGRSRLRNVDVEINDTKFMADVNSLSPSDLINKYRDRYKYFTHTELEFNNGYALIPKNYQEIYRSWYKDTVKKKNGDVVQYTAIRKIKDGQGRRKKLYIAALIMKFIQPNITYEHLLFNLINERYYYYVNTDKVLTNMVLMDIAKNVINTPIENIHLQSQHKKKFVVDRSYCAHYNIKPNAMKNVVRKILHDAEIGELYDCSKSVKENLALLREMGIKVGKTKLYDWCKENGINTKGQKTMEVYHNPYTELMQVALYYYHAKSRTEKQSLKCVIMQLCKELKEVA